MRFFKERSFTDRVAEIIGLTSDREMSEAVSKLIASSHLEIRFFIMSVLSGLMAAIGLILHDMSILIGAMVLAPIINPILAFSAGLLLAHPKLMKYAIKSLFGGLCSVILVTAIFTKFIIFMDKHIDLTFFPEKFATPDAFFYLLISSFLSGVAAVYAWLRATNSLNLVGIAIAVSLIPFISFLGMLLGVGHYLWFAKYSLLFGFNILSLILGAVAAFIVLRFSESPRKIDQDIKHAEKNEIQV